MLVLENLHLAVASRTLFDDFGLAVAAGEIVTLMGSSGSGKSSLLAHVCGTLPPTFETGGSVVLDGLRLDRLPPERRGVGILFQDDLLFSHLTVGGNLAFGLPADIRDRTGIVAAALADAEMVGFEERDPATLSGGQRQRIALMRALLARPRAILLDEPFGSLDIDLRERLRSFVFGHIRQRGLPCILATHDPADAAAAGGPVVKLAG